MLLCVAYLLVIKEVVRAVRYANIESSPVSDTSCLVKQIYDLINRQFLCGKCPKPVTIQYLHVVRYLLVFGGGVCAVCKY